LDLKAHIKSAHGISALNARLRQIVYGGNDGIVTTFAVVAGFAGAGAEGTAQIGAVAVILFGLANLFADAASMGLGEYLSSRAERDVYRKNRREEIRRFRTETVSERKEVLAILAEKGLSGSDARAFADQLEHHPELMADFMMLYEFGLSAPEDGEEVWNGLTTFISFLAFGVLPLLPFFFGVAEADALAVSAGSSLGALLLLGLLRAQATGERHLRCVVETLLVGLVCGAVAYVVGWVVMSG
jgi:VIT1/CCC1 family predicted Fe2+/Mn2+ transporter